MNIEEQSLHDHLVTLLREQIRTSMNPQAKLPSERALAAQYDVSRNTVRAALAKLEVTGVIYRRRGKGTFVANPIASPTDLSETYSFSEQMIDQGRTPSSKVLYLKQFPADSFIVAHLHIPLGTPTYKLKRLRLADGVALMVERTYMPADRFPKLTSSEIEKQGLYNTMAVQYNSAITDATEAFYASLMSDADAKLLNVPQGSPSLSVQRTATGTGGEIVEFTISITRADQFIYRYQHRHKRPTTT